VAVLAEEGGMVFALDAESGRERWRRPAGDRILAPPTGWITSDGRQRILVLNQPDGDVHALDAEAGTTLWTREGSARSDGPVSTDGQRIVHGTCAATLCVLAADDGTTLYTVPLGTGHEVAGGIALADGRAYGGTRGGDLFCADLETGAVVWRRAGHAADMFNTPAVDKERVVYSAGEAVYAVDLENGHPLWEQSLGTGPVGSPVTDGKTIVVAVGGRMVMLDAEDGRPVWHREVSDSMAGPAAVEGVLVVGTDDGFVVAFGEERRATDARTP
jgi:outer membrane protein assembly factor BamB